METQSFEFPIHRGHACSAGSGRGSDSLSGDGTLNIPSGYIKTENFVYREDNSLRPPFGESNFGLPLGEGAIRAICATSNTYYAISSEGKLYYTEDLESEWQEINWKGSGSAPLLEEGNYQFSVLGNGKLIFKNTSAINQPTFIIDPVDPLKYFWSNWGRTNWAQGHSVAAGNVPVGDGEVFHTFEAPDEPGMVVGRYMFGNNKIYNYSTMEVLQEVPNLYGGWTTGDCRISWASGYLADGWRERVDKINPYRWWEYTSNFYSQGICIGIKDGIRYIILQYNEGNTDYATGHILLVKDNFQMDTREVIDVENQHNNRYYNTIWDGVMEDILYPDEDYTTSFPLYSFDYSYAHVAYGSDDDGNYIECKVYDWDNEEVASKKYYYQNEVAVIYPVLYSDGSCAFWAADLPEDYINNYEGTGHKFYYASNSNSDWELIIEDVYFMCLNMQIADDDADFSGCVGDQVQWIISDYEGIKKTSIAEIPTEDSFQEFTSYIPGRFYYAVASNNNYRINIKWEDVPYGSGLFPYVVHDKYNNFVRSGSIEIPWHPEIDPDNIRNSRKTDYPVSWYYDGAQNEAIITDDNICYIGYECDYQSYDYEGNWIGSVKGVIGFDIITGERVFNFQHLGENNNYGYDSYTKLYLHPDGKMSLVLYQDVDRESYPFDIYPSYYITIKGES